MWRHTIGYEAYRGSTLRIATRHRLLLRRLIRRRPRGSGSCQSCWYHLHWRLDWTTPLRLCDFARMNHWRRWTVGGWVRDAGTGDWRVEESRYRRRGWLHFGRASERKEGNDRASEQWLMVRNIRIWHQSRIKINAHRGAVETEQSCCSFFLFFSFFLCFFFLSSSFRWWWWYNGAWLVALFFFFLTG